MKYAEIVEHNFEKTNNIWDKYSVIDGNINVVSKNAKMPSMMGWDCRNIYGNEEFFEKYWEPFDKDFKHRMYSVTKSFVAIAIGFLVQEGKLSLNERIVDLQTDFRRRNFE